MATLAQVIKANPTIAALRQKYPEIAAALNAPTAVANPVTKAPKVSKPLGLLDVFNAIAQAAPADMAKAALVPGWMIDRAEIAMRENDRIGMGNWLVSIGAAAGLSEAAKAALQTLMAQTIDDPTWMATKPGASIAAEAGLGVVTAEQVQAADKGGVW